MTDLSAIAANMIANAREERRDPYFGVINVGADGRDVDAPPIAANDERRLHVVGAASLAGKPVPARAWHVEDLIPAGTVTLLNGDGGTGKSLLALQLAVATVTGGYWAGRLAAGGGVFFASAEDDLDEIHRRLVDIVAEAGIGLADLDRLTIAPLAGEDALLAVPEAKGNVLRATPLYGALDRLLRDKSPALLILDTLADLFGGEENQRAQARQFIGLLRRLCVQHGVTIVLLAHPSLAGMASGTGTSGSTAWNNSVRSRLYLDRVKGEDGEADPDTRVLRTVKANYGKTGNEIRLQWRAGVFKPIGTGDTFAAVAAASKAERIFLLLLRAYGDEGRHVSNHSNAPTYAPAAFGKDPRNEGVKARGFTDAMSRLFAAGRIKVGRSSGPPSKQREIIIEVRQGEAQ